MASRSSTSRSILLAAALLAAAAVLAAGATADVPSYCAKGQAIPENPVPGCLWYAASRTCGIMPLYPEWAFKQMCCEQLEAIPAECRCRALRLSGSLTKGGGGGAENDACARRQVRFAPAVVTTTECGLMTIHGRPFCGALDGE